MTPEQIQHLEETVYLDYHILRLITPGRALALISWTGNGIVDTDFDPTYELDIKENSVSMQGYPKTLTSTQAYDQKYAETVDFWNPGAEHTISLTINSDFKRSLTLAAEDGAPPIVVTTPINPSDTNVELINVDRGMRIKLNVCSQSFRTQVKNVRIEKAAGAALPELRYQSSAPVPYTLPSVYNEYLSAYITGKEDFSLDAVKFDPIYNNREKFLASVEYNDDYNNYIVEPNTDLIDNYDPTLIISKGDLIELDPMINNDPDALYYIESTETYYRYRPDVINIPYQARQDVPSYTSKLINLIDIDPDEDGSFILHVDGTKSPGGTARIKSAFMSSGMDLTSYSITVTNTATLDTYLDPGVNFMDEFTQTDDLDVVDGVFYTYKVILETWDNKEFTIFTGTKRRELPSKSSIVPTGMNLEDLTIPLVGDNGLNEYDFQSGVGHSGCKLFLSDDSEDLRIFRRNKKLEEDCKCRNL